MTLKRTNNPANKENTNGGINFRQAAGLSMDFLKGESSQYLVATDDCAIHRCSKSYNEQYLDSFYDHTGPVYKVRCNPFNSDIFLSCFLIDLQHDQRNHPKVILSDHHLDWSDLPCQSFLHPCQSFLHPCLPIESVLITLFILHQSTQYLHLTILFFRPSS